MKCKKVFLVLLTATLFLASCSSSGKMLRSGKGGCGCTKGMSGY